MTTAIKRRRGTTTQHSSFTGLEGELTVDTTKDTVVVHDGSTAGGFPLLREDLNNNTNVLTTSNSKTLTNKTINLTDNTLSGTLAQFNTAVSDADLVSIAGSETLTNKTLTSPNINTATISGGTINNAVIGGSQAAAATVTNLTASGTVNFNGATISNLGTITTADINGGTIDGTSIGSSSASTGAFTTLSASSTVSGTGFSTYLASPPAIGGTTAAAGKFTTLEATGVTTVSAGTVSAPAITTTGDTNTGIFFPAADTIAFAEGGVEAMRIDSSGNVAIGSTSSAGYRFNTVTSGNPIAQFSGSTVGYVDVTDGTGVFRMQLLSNTPNIGSATNHALNFVTNGTIRYRINTSGQLVADSDGTAALPVLSRSTDLNTGLFFAAADTLAISTGGSERMRIDSSGNVGIGTTAPDSKLTVYNATGTTQLRFGASSNYYWDISRDNDTTGSLWFSNYNASGSRTTRMAIDSSGNVGIGTSSPAVKLNAVGSIAASDSTTPAKRLQLDMGASSGTINCANYGSDMMDLNIQGENLIFNTGLIGVAERMRIDSSGNVGIGTSSPVFASGGGLSVYNATAARIKLGDSTSGIGSLDGVELIYDDDAFLWNRENTALIFATNSTERMRITSGGEVYIAGTTDQGAYNLQCNGTGVWGAGAYVNGSDARIKEDVAPIDSGLDVVEKLNPVTYRYKEDWSKDQSVQTGFIAQELLTALDGKNYVDGVVQQGGSEGYYSVAYQNIIPILTKAIQELSAKNAALEARISALESN